mmetsp:Transcript_25228/g.69575  ORF Transcript_25228/g.69575 Transcript_25228/m.69575 type:complete len:190 (-) Transcript_25228:1385-1954(-)
MDCTQNNSKSRARRCLGFVTGVMLMGTADALIHNSMPLKSRHYVSNASSSSLSVTMSSVEDQKKAKFRPNPVVVSAEAEALSHSDTTMKLTPSYDLFQMLSEDEGGEAPVTTSGNAMRDGSMLKGEGGIDELEGVQLSMFKGCGGKMKIETLPDPFKMVEKELQPFSDSIKELVSTDQPILSMAAKHFF